MIIMIAGTSHTGKTLLAQRLLELTKFPYLSIDHLKMGLIRSGNTTLTPCDDAELTDYLWPIVREMIKTAIENNQNMIVEGCYIPYSWKDDFTEEYLCHIHCRWLIMTSAYIKNHFSDIQLHGSDIENRLDDSWLEPTILIEDNETNLQNCRLHNCEYILIDDTYEIPVDWCISGLNSGNGGTYENTGC